MNENQPRQTGGEKTNVVLLFGGRSGEHAISCVTAGNVMRAIDRERFEVIPIGITAQGKLVPAADDPDVWQIRDGELPAVPDSDAEILLPSHPGTREIRLIDAGGNLSVFGEADVVFPLLHGPYGEDGTIQGQLELSGLPYVGCGVLSSALSMDKHFAKVALSSNAIPVVPYTVVTPAQWERDPALCEDAVASLGFPVFVKPARAGSSIGIRKVDRPEDLRESINYARETDPKVIVEAAINGREIECAVLGGTGLDRPRTTVPGEICVTDAAHAFYDFEAKYLIDDATELLCPAELPDPIADDVRSLAAKAFLALECEGLARVDFFVTERGQVLINEVNTMPGFTPISMYPLLWQHMGIAYAELVTELIELALARPVTLR